MSSHELAYVAVWEEATSPKRSVQGWYIGIAKLGESGYHQCAPGYGPYPSHEEAQSAADLFNKKMGLTREDAVKIVLSTMGKR